MQIVIAGSISSPSDIQTCLHSVWHVLTNVKRCLGRLFLLSSHWSEFCAFKAEELILLVGPQTRCSGWDKVGQYPKKGYRDEKLFMVLESDSDKCWLVRDELTACV